MSARSKTVGESAGGPPAWLIALAGAGMAAAGWFAPDACAPAAALLCAGGFLWRGRQGAADPTGLAIAAGVTAVFCVKDLTTPGPLGRAATELGVASGWTARQPDAAAACSAAAVTGIVVVVFQLLRTTLADEGGARAWGRAVVAVSAALAAAVLTAPQAARDYGDGFFYLGEVASRNAAAGACALAATVAAGLMVDALRAGRGREWPLAAAGAGLCAAAAASLGSRGGLVALMAGAVYFAARAGDRRARRWVVPAGVVVIGALLIAPGTVARLGNPGDEYRLELWTASLRVWQAAPFGGAGGGGFADAFALFSGLVPDEGSRVTHPDSSWVLLLTEWGVLGVAVMAAAGWLLSRGSDARVATHGLRIGAEAGLIVWAVAAIGDISFHRAVTLAIGLPLLAIVWPRAAKEEEARPRAWPRLAGATLAMVLAFLATREGGGPLDMRANHERGFAALNEADAEGAAKFFTAAAAVDPANTEALRLYARALMPTAPERALPLWQKLFVAAGPRASVFLGEELTREQTVPLRYWMKAAEARPETWVLLADRDEAGAQRCFEGWRKASSEAKAKSPQRPTLGALARWGSAADLTAWKATIPEVSIIDGVHGAHLLKGRGRGDLAWTWLAGVLPPPESIALTEPDAGLRARVLANPDDHVAAARLLAQTESADERERLLRRWSERAEAPPWFRIRLAHTLRETGRRDEALAMLIEAAEAMHRAQVAGGG